MGIEPTCISCLQNRRPPPAVPQPIHDALFFYLTGKIIICCQRHKRSRWGSNPRSSGRQPDDLATNLRDRNFIFLFPMCFSKSAGQDLNLQCLPCGYRFYRPVRSPLRYLPLTIIRQVIIIDFHFFIPPFSFCCFCPCACTGRYIIRFSEHVTGFEPVPPVWKTGMQPITPYVHLGREVPVSSPLY